MLGGVYAPNMYQEVPYMYMRMALETGRHFYSMDSISQIKLYATFADDFNRNKRFRCDVELYYS